MKTEITASELGKIVFFKDGHVLWGPFPISVEVTVQIGGGFLDHMDSGSASGRVEKRL